ncbi:MAG: hypothetical protein J6B59_05565 [Alistipes sp.]|nr:hypothetical protein [Alistipes sp.]MBQ8917039.1 hypothetical protein [Alistipes sp.]
MKNFFRFLMLALLATTTMVNVACSDDDDAPANALIGTWVEDIDDMPYILTFNANGTGSLQLTNSGGTSMSTPFEYIYYAAEHQVDIIGSALAGSHYVVITANSLVLSPSSGINYYFKRQ